MATDIDIANLALSHLGDVASVSSIDPPEGSAQAEHCAIFYPMARDSMLESHTWGFATRRVALGLLGDTGFNQWAYCYSAPSDALKLLAVLDPSATSDYSQTVTQAAPYFQPPQGVYAPQPFETESLADGSQVILTNQSDAILRYTAKITDTAKFPPLFVLALSWHLASMLAGPILKGDAGTKKAVDCSKIYQYWFQLATESDANQRKTEVTHNVAWMAAR